MRQGRSFLYRNFLALVILGVMGVSCGPKRRSNPLPKTYTDTLGPFGVVYRDGNEFDYPVTEEFRTEALRRIDVVHKAYEQQYNWWISPVELRVYPGLVSGVPCGGPNGGACFRNDDILFVNGDIWSLFHELNHRRLWQQGRADWQSHLGAEWDKVWKFDAEHQ